MVDKDLIEIRHRLKSGSPPVLRVSAETGIARRVLYDVIDDKHKPGYWTILKLQQFYKFK